jgi:hypothetical protein
MAGFGMESEQSEGSKLIFMHGVKEDMLSFIYEVFLVTSKDIFCDVLFFSTVP